MIISVTYPGAITWCLAAPDFVYQPGLHSVSRPFWETIEMTNWGIDVGPASESFAVQRGLLCQILTATCAAPSSCRVLLV